jgi:CheY-like chemotaxis protein
MSQIDNEVLLSVRDTGRGIPADRLEVIFEPFFSTKGKEGTGLGLSVVYGIIQQHNGMIQVSSQEGTGTTFFIKLPLADSAELQSLAASTEVVTQFEGARRKILLVEDEVGVLRFMQHALEDKNYDVRAATNLRDARDMFDVIGSEIDLVLTDAVLPDGNGVELIDYALQKRSDLGVVLCSGYTDKNPLLDLAQSRDITFLQKPFSILKLYRTVHDVISGQAVSTLD